METMKEMVESVGFDVVGEVDPADFIIREEVRDMCASNRCGKYNSSWACPPACGSLEEYREKIARYKHGLVFQTIARMEDDFDFETIQEGSELHSDRFNKLVDLLSESDRDFMALSAGTCTRCPKCTYPDEPCRFPDRIYPSMEACGLVVAETCTAAGIPYNHGPQTLAFCSCVIYN